MVARPFNNPNAPLSEDEALAIVVQVVPGNPHGMRVGTDCPTLGEPTELLWRVNGGRDRDRTDDLYRVKVALVPTELRARLRLT